MNPETTPIYDQTISETLIDPFSPLRTAAAKRPARKRKGS